MGNMLPMMFWISQVCVSSAKHPQKRRWLHGAAGATVILCACADSAADRASLEVPSAQASEAFATYWRDGLAEVSVYRLHQPRYGEVREGEAVWVTVTEPFDPTRLVKRDTTEMPYVEVLKLNDMRTFQTGVYDYSTMSSTFVPVAKRTPLKISASVQEWCGHIYEEVRWDGDRAHRELNSYFENEQERSQTWTQPTNGWTEDAFPLIMRRSDGSAALAPGEIRQIQWLPSRVGARLRGDDGSWRPAVLRRAASSRMHPTPEGATAIDEWSVEMNEGTHRWFVEASWPHGVVGWERTDGERGERVATQRLDYWSKQSLDNASLRAPLRRSEQKEEQANEASNNTPPEAPE